MVLVHLCLHSTINLLLLLRLSAEETEGDKKKKDKKKKKGEEKEKEKKKGPSKATVKAMQEALAKMKEVRHCGKCSHREMMGASVMSKGSSVVCRRRNEPRGRRRSG